MMLRSTLIRVLVVVVALAVVFLIIQKRSADSLTLASFIQEYTAQSDTHAQQAVASKYLDSFSVAQLNAAIEQKYPLSQCHVQGHGLGRAVYERDQNFTQAVNECGSSCSYGCFHGVLMQMFSTDSDTLGGTVEETDPAAYLAAVKTGAERLCASPEVQGVVTPIYCSHGVGHVFAVTTDYDLDASVRACGVFRSPEGRSTCASGVFMEYAFNPAKESAILKEGFARCEKYTPYESDCFSYMAHVLVKPGHIAEAIRECTAFATERLRNNCIYGVAYSQAKQSDFATQTGLDAICGTVPTENGKAACIKGALLRIVNQTDDKKTDTACDTMDASYRTRCIALLNRQRAATIN